MNKNLIVFYFLEHRFGDIMGLKEYAVRRFFTSLITIFIIIVANWLIFRLPVFVTGVDPAVLYGLDWAMRHNVPVDVIERFREQWGLPSPDSPLTVWLMHLLKYIWNMLTFNFGKTFRLGRPVVQELAVRLPITLMFMVPATLLSLIIGIWLGVKAGANPGSKTDTILLNIGLTLYAFPAFWIELLFVLVFISGYGIFYMFPEMHFFNDPVLYFLELMYVMIPPIICLVLVGFGGWLLFMRQSLIDVMHEDYIVTAKAKGLDERTVLYKHAFRNALLPVITGVVLALAGVWTGAIITETIFQIEGVGRLFLWAYQNQDYPLLEMLFYFVALTTVIANYIADISYALLDPRVRY